MPGDIFPFPFTLQFTMMGIGRLWFSLLIGLWEKGGPRISERFG